MTGVGALVVVVKAVGVVQRHQPDVGVVQRHQPDVVTPERLLGRAP